MRVFHDLKKMLEDELEKIVKQDTMTPQDLEGAYKAIDILKDIETIMAMREAYPNSYDSGRSMSNYYDMDESYARGRDSRGRYMSRAYSRHSEKERMIDKLETMYDMTSDTETRRAIDECIAKLERN